MDELKRIKELLREIDQLKNQSAAEARRLESLEREAKEAERFEDQHEAAYGQLIDGNKGFFAARRVRSDVHEHVRLANHYKDLKYKHRDDAWQARQGLSELEKRLSGLEAELRDLYGPD
jgi:DNA repair exonuclease SbcCD ATPase subunit